MRVARVYDAPTPEDGHRVLVDGLWPRGLRRDAAPLDAWCKAVAPSRELRTWYAHDPARFKDFTTRYRNELSEDSRTAALADLCDRAQSDCLTLLTATKALDLSHATVLAEVITEALT